MVCGIPIKAREIRAHSVRTYSSKDKAQSKVLYPKCNGVAVLAGEDIVGNIDECALKAIEMRSVSAPGWGVCNIRNSSLGRSVILISGRVVGILTVEGII